MHLTAPIIIRLNRKPPVFSSFLKLSAGNGTVMARYITKKIVLMHPALQLSSCKVNEQSREIMVLIGVQQLDLL